MKNVKIASHKAIFKKLALSAGAFSAVIFHSGTCIAYTFPDWEAIARANERQQTAKKQPYYNYDQKKELKKNKKQEIGKRNWYNYDKDAEEKLNKRQKISKNKYYTYDRKAEKARNKLQQPK